MCLWWCSSLIVTTHNLRSIDTSNIVTDHHQPIYTSNNVVILGTPNLVITALLTRRLVARKRLSGHGHLAVHQQQGHLQYLPATGTLWRPPATGTPTASTSHRDTTASRRLPATGTLRHLPATGTPTPSTSHGTETLWRPPATGTPTVSTSHRDTYSVYQPQGHYGVYQPQGHYAVHQPQGHLQRLPATGTLWRPPATGTPTVSTSHRDTYSIYQPQGHYSIQASTSHRETKVSTSLRYHKHGRALLKALTLKWRIYFYMSGCILVYGQYWMTGFLRQNSFCT